MNANDPPDTSTRPSCDSPVQRVQSTPTGYGGLAKKIRSRTTDLLAVAIVVIGGVTLGSQFAEWWNTGDGDIAPSLNNAANITWGDGETPVLLEFGGSPLQLERQALGGDREAAFARLIEKCEDAAKQTKSVATRLQPAEKKLLGLLERETPVREERGAWQVYRIERPMTMVIAARNLQPVVEKNREAGVHPELPPEPDQPLRRVVCWGMAQPNGEGRWVLFTMKPIPAGSASRPEAGEVELPASARRIMSLRDPGGGALIAFEGEASPQEWIVWFDAWFARRGWRGAQAWSESPAGWSVAFVPAELNEIGRVDVSFSVVENGRLNGLISVTARVTATTEGLQP